MFGDIHLKKDDALLIVDVQNDFCPGGALPIAEGDQVPSFINPMVREAVDSGIMILASRDWHPLGHVSFREEGGKWPVHCLQDTDGALFHQNLLLTRQTVVITKGVRFDKDQNSAFDETGLAVYLRKQGINRLFLCGLALDVCILATAMDGLAAGFEIGVVLAATRPVHPADGLAAVSLMQKAGAVMLGDPAQLDEWKKISESDTGRDSEELPICTKAPEWAEHHRLSDEDQPCDDGRTGKLDR